MSMSAKSMSTRVFCALIGLSCLGIVVVGVVSIASGGYRPEPYAGGFDPVRAGMIVCFGAGAAAFALVGGAGLAARWSGSDSTSLSAIAFWIGLAVATVSVLLIVASMPASSAPVAVPMPFRILLYLGAAIAAAGMFPPVLAGLAAAVRRRDRGLLVALLLFAAIVVIQFATRA